MKDKLTWGDEQEITEQARQYGLALAESMRERAAQLANEEGWDGLRDAIRALPLEVDDADSTE